MQVQINIVLSILLSILLGHAYFKMNKKVITDRLFVWIMGFTLLTLMLEAISVLLNHPSLVQFIVLNRIVNVAGFLVAPCIPFIGFLLTKEWANRCQKEKIKLEKILVLPLFINGMAALLSYRWGLLFYITSKNMYERGPLFFILPLVSYIYFGYNLYFIYKYRKKYKFSELIIFSLFFIVPSIFTFIQLKYSSYLTTWNSASIIMVATYIFILNDKVYRDSLTGIENRLSYEHYAQNIDQKRLDKLCIIYMDLDNLKMINDKYGHNEGDEAIKIFANLLVENFRTNGKKLIRLGGDEFVILLEEDHHEKLEVYIENFIQRVELYNKKGDKPYKIRFSHGMVKYTSNYENIHQLLEHADQLMYKQKQMRKFMV